eukprot:CAMPEP_0194535048 /NCGR_PEP_ID=MMETSP0253-20130528/73455_1 /TAXON_ID=2966 /ORGANISM="Noctiluca scintillans" /LENGTH=88 /DNA_ID=CAMNT_0039380771 /DNA_START=223 /DNA_END=490 /DNA_ORIENTATION=+
MATGPSLAKERDTQAFQLVGASDDLGVDGTRTPQVPMHAGLNLVRRQDLELVNSDGDPARGTLLSDREEFSRCAANGCEHTQGFEAVL